MAKSNTDSIGFAVHPRWPKCKMACALISYTKRSKILIKTVDTYGSWGIYLWD